MSAWGFDVSNHQRNFDFAQAKAEGYTFATHKVTESDNYKDPYWPRALNEMRTHFPGRFGGYHFYRRSANADAQAVLLEQHLGDKSVPIQLDFEDNNARNVTRQDLDRIVDAIQARGMRVFIDYIPQWYWDGYMNRAVLAGTGRPLWSSDYGPNQTGYGAALYANRGGDGGSGWAPYGGGQVAIWQYGEHGLVAGQSIDVNGFRGSAADLDALFGMKGSDVASVPEEVLAQETGSPVPGQYPGFKARRWGIDDANQPCFTQTDFMREVDREVNSIFDLKDAPKIAAATLVGHVLATRAELATVQATLSALLSVAQKNKNTI